MIGIAPIDDSISLESPSESIGPFGRSS
jgi:hypothetical protein